MPEGTGSPDVGPPKPPPVEGQMAGSSRAERNDLVPPETQHKHSSPEALVRALKSGDPEQMAEAGNRITLMQDEDLPPFDPREAAFLGFAPPAGGPSPDREPRLRDLDTEVVQRVGMLGMFEERGVLYRISQTGRRVLVRVQDSLRGLQEKRVVKAENDLRGARRAVLDAEREIKDREPHKLDRYKDALDGLRIKEDRRHSHFEASNAGRSAADLAREAEDLSIDYQEMAAWYEPRILELQRAISGGDPGRDDPAGHRTYVENYTRLMDEEQLRRERLDVLERQRNSALYLMGRAELEDADNALLVGYWEAEQRYVDIRSERRDSSSKKIEAGAAFVGDMPFRTALDIAEGRVSGTPAERSEAKEVVESYFREAGRRGYLAGFKDGMEGYLGAIQEALASRGQRISLTQDQLARARIMVEQAKNESRAIRRVTLEDGTEVDMTFVERFIHQERSEGKRRDGVDPDAVMFNEVIGVWLDRMDKYVVDLATNPRAECLYNGEFTMASRGKGWYISEYGTPVVERHAVTTKEDFEACMWSYADFLIGGSVDRSPQQLFQKLQQFSEFFQGLAADRFPQFAQMWRMQLKAFVGTYAADYFASLANTPNMEAALTETFREADGIDVLPAAFMAMDGQVGLAIRLMNRRRRFRPMHRYSGENGGIAFHVTTRPDGHQDLATGSLEYIVRDSTELLLAQEVMIYELSESLSSSSSLAPREASERDANLRAVANFQTTAEFMEKYSVNNRTLRIRDALRRGQDISEVDREYYQEKLDKAIKAVSFARRIESATGERARKASPSYIVPVCVRDHQGRLIDRDGHVITKTEIKVENPKAKDMWWVKRALKRIPTHTVEHKKSGDPVVERVDYLDELGSTQFMQFADSLGRILAQRDNERAQAAYVAARTAFEADTGNASLRAAMQAAEAKLRPVNAWEIRNRANEFRRRAKLQLSMYGYGAKILDQNGEELCFIVKKQTKGSDFQDGTLVDIDSARTLAEVTEMRYDARHEALIALGHTIPVTAAELRSLTRAQIQELEQRKYDSLGAAEKAEIDARVKESVGDYQTLDFDQASTHILAGWNAQTYLGYQQEIKSQLLSAKVRMDALRIRRGEILPEEADPLASMLLQLDPTLTRLRPTMEDKPHLKVINACVAESFSRHFRIRDELALQFSRSDGSIRSYYGIPNERFSWKELLYSADKLNREPERFGRRGYLLFNRSPVHAFTFAEGFGGDLPMAVGASTTRRDEFIRGYDKEVTDSNVYAGWISRINRAYAVLVRLAKGGQLGQEAVVPLGLKPFNDLDSMTGRIKAAFQNGEGHHGFLESFRKCLGRLEATLKSIESQDNVTGESGAFRIEAADVRYVRLVDGVKTYVFPTADDRNVVYDYAEVCFYNNAGKPIPDNRSSARVRGEVWRRLDQQNVTTDVGLGAWSAKTFLYSSFIPYARENGPQDYPHEAWAIELTEGLEVWQYIDSKAINTGEGGR